MQRARGSLTSLTGRLGIPVNALRTQTKRTRAACLGAMTSVTACALVSLCASSAGHPAVAAPAQTSVIRALLGAHQWLNTPGLKPQDLQGKVVLVNFWTFSCINCLRMLPCVREWAAKYKDRGLVVVGVQTPEFAFEKDVRNISNAVTDLGVLYPVAVDNDSAIWRAFSNNAWPALYFIGPDGEIRRQVVGEGQYAQSEQLIQQLLSDADGRRSTSAVSATEATGSQAAADIRDLRSPETYVGYGAARGFDSPESVSGNAANLYSAPATLPLNHWALTGTWTIGSEFAALTGATGRIRYRFHARDVHLVLANSTPAHRIRFRVTIDGAPPGVSHGSDVDADGRGVLNEDRLYQLVRQPGPVVDRTIEIEFLDSGVRAYAFTFG
jgi:thiol-disulfide isomerase/thioredoxin